MRRRRRWRRIRSKKEELVTRIKVDLELVLFGFVVTNNVFTT